MGSVVALVLNILLVPQYGMVAAAWATASSYAVMAIILLSLVQRAYPVPYEWGRVLSLVAGAVILFFLWDAFEATHIWWIELLLLSGYSILAFFITGVKRLGRN